MKILTLVSFWLLFCSLGPAAAVAPKQFQEVSLVDAKQDAIGCEAKWTSFVNRLVWIDETHLVAWLLRSCWSHEPKDIKSERELMFFDTAGHLNTLRHDDTFGVLRGPSGTA